ncbi:MAG TPA: gephyrin-like molybdotransferase Glp [Chloroflexota bacterium]|nr:gephyrin-like molybdotransferase Glp [Chloroflexota bacterium]
MQPHTDFPKLLPLDRALPQILDQIPVLETEEKPILEALGQVLAEDVVSTEDVPPHANSGMDGFAVRSADTPGRLRVIADQAAGHVTDRAVEPGTAIRIMTGAVLPAGADTVVPVEDTDGGRDGVVNIGVATPPRANIREAGEDVRRGECVLPAGTPLSAGTVGVLASIGRGRVKVYRRPVVAFMASGDELVGVEEPLTPGKIRNSNSYTLRCQIEQAGGVPRDLGVARDTLDDIRAHVEEGLKADLFITSAGVSVGDFDYVKQVLEEHGRLELWRIAIRPGKPVAFGMFEGTPVISLPGNPVSSMVTFEIFVRPAIAKMMGHTQLEPPSVEARVLDEIDNRGGRRSFLRAIVSREGQDYVARLTGPQGSGILTSMARANALLDVAAEDEWLPAGSTVRAILLSAHS